MPDKFLVDLHILFCSCAELLVLKAELELMKGATEASSLDLEQVRNLLDLCTGKYVILITKSRHLDPFSSRYL